MESLVKQFNEWEMKLLVLLSFTLQWFLFFAGSLRRHGTSGFLRLSIWAAYLGADLVAVYSLGLLSRHEDITPEGHIPWRTQPLDFFWAPFLLIHLGGQDTITAFSMEDNNLWLRHLLNQVVQVVLAMYVFWKSIGRHNVELLVSGILVFVAGAIKYGERTWSLKCGSLESSTGHHYINTLPEEINFDDGYYSIVCVALDSMPYILGIFSVSSLFARSPLSEETLRDPNKMLKVVRLQLGMMHDDLYTKTIVLRTRSAIILRCISQISVLVAFALFYANDKWWYSRGDIVITYTLFIGGFLLEVCAVFTLMMSPWTWAWLKVQKCNMLARLSWLIFSSDIGWPEKEQRWPNFMGQYNLQSWLTGNNNRKPRTCNQRVMAVVKRLFMDLIGVEKKKIFWVSKLLDTEYVNVDKMMLEYVAKEISLLHDEFPIGDVPTEKPPHGKERREWKNIEPLLQKTQTDLGIDFGRGIFEMHMLTEIHLCKYPSPSDMEANNAGMVEVCRKLSHYMMYLLVTHPSMLPLNISAEATLGLDPKVIEDDLESNEEFLEPSKETLEGMVHMWIRLLIYAAGKSRVEMHKAQLSRGGELITFVWLFMSHYGLGDSQVRRIQITNADNTMAPSVPDVYAFYDSSYSISSDESSSSPHVDVPSSPSNA
ncbi:hypothetical protein ACQ4PT_041843 [Festuca glaucescens]